MYCKRKTWKGEITKKWLNKGERDTCLTHVCKLPWSIECFEKIEKTEAFNQYCISFLCFEAVCSCVSGRGHCFLPCLTFFVIIMYHLTCYFDFLYTIKILRTNICINVCNFFRKMVLWKMCACS